MDCGTAMPALNAVRGIAETKQTPRENAIREFLEETGIEVAPKDMEFLGICRPDSGSLATHLCLFRAWLTPAHLQGRKAVAEKEISTIVCNNPELFETMAKGLLPDAITHQVILLSQLVPQRKPSQLETLVKLDLPTDKIKVPQEAIFEKAQELLYPMGLVYKMKKHLVQINGTAYGTEKQYDDLVRWVKDLSVQCALPLTLTLNSTGGLSRVLYFLAGEAVKPEALV